MTIALILLGTLIAALPLLWQVKPKSRRGARSQAKQAKTKITGLQQADLLEEWTPQKPTQNQARNIVWNKEFLLSIEWKLFEDVCAEYLRLKQHNASVTNIGKDGGIDLIIKDETGRITTLGQCKAWKALVGVSQVRELYGVMAAEKVEQGLYFTTSTFSKDAWQFSKDKKLTLVSGDELLKNINKLERANRAKLDELVKGSDYDVPTCVSCNVKMVKKSSSAAHNNRAFWGCRNFPRCRNTLQIRATTLSK